MAEMDDDKAAILSTLGDIENSGFEVLLQQLFAQLKVPYPRPPAPWPGLCRCQACSPALLSVAQISGSNATKFRRAVGQVTPQHQSANSELLLLELVLKPAGETDAAT